MNIRRGDIYYADLSPVVGSEQGGIRPVLIVQNNVGNRFSPTVIAAAITSQQSKANLPTHIPLHADSSGLAKDSVVLLEQVRTIDKKRLKEKMGTVDENSMNEITQYQSRSVLTHNSALHTDNAIKENKQTTKRSVQLEKNSKPTDRCLLCYFTSMLHHKRICSTKVNLLF